MPIVLGDIQEFDVLSPLIRSLFSFSDVGLIVKGQLTLEGEKMTRKNSTWTHCQDSPVERERKAGPCGDGNWPGFSAVYAKISAAAEKMARAPHVHLYADHVATMADLGSGHEERMKYRLHWLRTYNWL